MTMIRFDLEKYINSNVPQLANLLRHFNNMKFTVPFTLAIVCFLFTVENVRCARVLGLIPVAAYSHQLIYQPLWHELAKRGHEVVLITPFHVANANFTQIITRTSTNLFDDMDYIQFRLKNMKWPTYIQKYATYISEIFARNLFELPQVKELYSPSSNATFDVVLTDIYYTPSVMMLAHRFNAPLIGLVSTMMISCDEFILGAPLMASHESTWEMTPYIKPNLSFWRRLQNFFILARTVHFCHDLFSHHHKIAEDYFGTNIPPLLDVAKNISLMFVNQNEILLPARIKLPNVISFSSSHIKKNPPPLSEDLQRFVDGATSGFIYFSLGSIAKTENLPKEILQVFVDVFSKVPYRVVWRHKGELPQKSANIYTASWFPQQSILSHRNAKLFMYQAGLQSTQEAIHFTVPVISFPVLADQDFIGARMEALGVGKQLNFATLTREQLKNAIQDIMTDENKCGSDWSLALIRDLFHQFCSIIFLCIVICHKCIKISNLIMRFRDAVYKLRIRQIKHLTKDTPHDLMKLLVWWTEFVIRNKGAPHLHNTMIDMPWYQRYDLDVIVFSAIAAYILIWSVSKWIIRIFIHVYRLKSLTARNEKQKTN
ncbi:UDP-glycosyltransferase UGT5-like [Calliopsis andreniformis]|uniref:UDP-glycosyltransferase UGT5-like n=1 Tax=Calliopsis andreniformis TaxID=337506 RepID=UPI003FCE2D82